MAAFRNTIFKTICKLASEYCFPALTLLQLG